MSSRTQDIDKFLASAGWGSAMRAPLAGDASFRRYERVNMEGKQAVLMDAPPPHEDVRPFIRAVEALQSYGLSAPRILHADVEKGFLLLEDLGDDLYSRVLRKEPESELELYREASRVLEQLYHDGSKVELSAFPPYDEALLMRECMLLAEWFLPAVMPQEQAEKLAGEYRQLWLKLLKALPPLKPVLVMRDYHADNLLWIPERKGTQKVGLLDFQDAVAGSPAYDMVSFLEDARRDVSDATVAATIEQYVNSTGMKKDDFMTSYALLGAQRNCKIVGIFVRLCVRDGKQNYLSFLPRVWGHLHNDLKHPQMKELAAWMDKYIKPEWRGVISAQPAKKQASA